MKNKILITILLLSSLYSYSQCIPDQNYTSPGIYPDQNTGLPSALIGQPYSAIITALTPLDTVVDISGLSLNVTIANIDLTNVIGLPNNFTYDCQPPNCSFPGGAYSCAEIFSTIDPSVGDLGVYPLILTTSTLAINVPLLGTYTQLDTVDYFYIEIIAPTSTSFGSFNDETFEFKNIYPNPVKSESEFYFISGEIYNLYFLVYNTFGEIVYSSKINALRGVNSSVINVDNYLNGIYTIVLKSDSKTISTRMLVVN
jgi:hypothetical protein